MFTFHVLFIAHGRYEVCSDDGRLSVEFTNRHLAETYADVLRNGGTTEEAQQRVNKEVERSKKRSAASKARNDALRSLGMKRNRDGSWE